MRIPERLRGRIQEYARLIVRVGANVQRGQEVVVRCQAESVAFVRLVVAECYLAGARDVIVHWSDSVIARERLLYAAEDALATVPAWRAASMNEYAERGAAFVSLVSDDPEAFAGVDTRRIAVSQKASNQAFRSYFEKMTASVVPWTVAAVPGAAWAGKVFPGISAEEAEERLWEAILQTVRVDGREDPARAWEEHERRLRARCEWMNERQFVRLHYRSGLGTDFTVGLVKNHIWEGGSEACASGVRFQANLPTEEIFTMPDRNTAEGKLVASMPLANNGSIITSFSFTFRNGCVVDYQAERGANALAQILETDAESRYLGEVALVPCTSPVRRQKLLFYNTLFDENAACHFALGECYPTTVRGGAAMSREELRAIGGNTGSANHVDFMVGTDDLSITGITAKGNEIPVFTDGDFAF